MRYTTKYPLLFLMLVFSMFNLVSSVPPVTTVQAFPQGYIIAQAQQELLKINTNHTYHFYLYNSSNGKNIIDPSVICTLVMANSAGEVLFYENVSRVSNYWEINISGEYFSYIGEYSYGVNCQDGNGGALAGTFQTSLSGKPQNTLDFLSYLLLLLSIIGIINFMLQKHGKSDFKSSEKNIIQNHKNMGETMVRGILTGLFKNSFIWLYFLGWLLVLVLREIIFNFGSIVMYEYFTLIANMYSLGLILVTVYMIGYTLSYMRNIFSILTDNSWGVGN